MPDRDPCRLPDCDRPCYARRSGLCRPHERRRALYGDPYASGRVGPEVTTPPALVAAGLTRRQITYWCNQGHINAPVVGANRRQWTDTEVAVALAMVNLVRAGLSHAKAAQLARESVAGRTAHDLAPGVRLHVEPPAEKAAS